MNTKNNKRRRDSVAAIEKAFIELLETRDFRDITVSDLCKLTGLNRSTFYANFDDLYALADHIRRHLEADFTTLFDPLPNPTGSDSSAALRMFTHIYENQAAYKTYFKLGFADSNGILQYDLQRAEQDFHGEYIDYHIAFFRAGLNALIRRWLDGGCKESPAVMESIIRMEYRGR